MPIKTFYIKNAAASESVQGSLQDGGSAPTAATTGSGWTVGKTALGNFAYFDYGVTLAAGTFTTTDMFANATSNVALSNTTIGRAWRSEDLLNGVFDAGNWTFTTVYRTGTAGTHNGRLNAKIFHSPNANGSANVTVVSQTSSKLTFSNTGAMTSTATDYLSSFTWSAPRISINNEFLFFECQWETTAAGNNNVNSVLFRVGSTANVVTANFTQRNKTATIT